MQIQISPDQCYCSFVDGIVYEFVPTDCVPPLNNCHLCDLWTAVILSGNRMTCWSVPCLKWQRRDKNSGFWRISETADYQAFVKMLAAGG